MTNGTIQGTDPNAYGAATNGAGSTVTTNTTVPFKYFPGKIRKNITDNAFRTNERLYNKKLCIFVPDDSDLNYWMLAMIGIGCIFIVFVGFSIYLMW